MMTMYEKLMMLPVFKGISEEAFISLIEKTHLHFDTYEAGTLLTDISTRCESLICVLSGEVEVTHSLLQDSIIIKVRYDAGKVLGLEHLFGMDTRYAYKVEAITQCGTMKFTKTQYMDMLKDNNICLLNFLNYLSYRIQRMESGFENYNRFSCMGKISILLSLFTERNCKECKILLDCQNGPEINKELSLLCNEGLIEVKEGNTIIIPSRNDFLDFAEEYLTDRKNLQPVSV